MAPCKSNCEGPKAELSDGIGWLRKDSRLHLEKKQREAPSLQERQRVAGVASVASALPLRPLILYSESSLLYWVEFSVTKKA